MRADTESAASTACAANRAIHSLRPLLACFVLSGLPSSALADHFDVLFYEFGGQLATGATDFGPPFSLLPDVRVFVEPLPIGDVTSNPGFTASSPPPAGNALPGDTEIAFDVLPEPLLEGRTLSRWDLAGEVAFEDPGGVRIRVREGSCFTCASVPVDGGTERLPGFTLGTTSATGTLHRHHEIFLLPPVGSGSLAPAGAYLLALTARVEGFLESPPFYVLFGKQASAAQLEAAARWVEDVLLVPEPGPTASGVAVLAVLIALSRRRGKQA